MKRRESKRCACGQKIRDTKKRCWECDYVAYLKHKKSGGKRALPPGSVPAPGTDRVPEGREAVVARRSPDTGGRVDCGDEQRAPVGPVQR